MILGTMTDVKNTASNENMAIRDAALRRRMAAVIESSNNVLTPTAIIRAALDEMITRIEKHGAQVLLSPAMFAPQPQTPIAAHIPPAVAAAKKRVAKANPNADPSPKRTRK